MIRLQEEQSNIQNRLDGYTMIGRPFDLLAITNTTWQRKKAAGADSSDLRPIWLPTLDNLRNFLLTASAEVLSFFQQLREAP